jgi:hypothetical protein
MMAPLMVNPQIMALPTFDSLLARFVQPLVLFLQALHR